MNFCIPTELVNRFIGGLKSGDIDPAKLASMTSDERRAAFAAYVGAKDAPRVNALFESKLLLKNRQRGMIAWARDVAGLRPEVRRDLIARIEKLDGVLTPADERKFLEDLASQKLGLGVSADEAARIAALSRNVEEARAAAAAGGDRLAYGRAKVSLANYVNELTEVAGRRTAREVITQPVETLSRTAGFAKSIKASLDNSAIFRQGWKTLWTNPNVWRRNAAKTFSDIARSVGGEVVLDEVMADIVSRPTYNAMVKAKLAVGNIEEAFPTSLPEKIPGFGRLFRASQDAYTGFLYRTRADVFDRYLDIAEASGVNLRDPRELESIGKLVNSLTGRSTLPGNLDKAASTLNNVFFSPRFVMSQIDFLAQPVTGAGGSSFVRKQAAINLLKVISGTAAVLGIAKAIDPKSVEFDPRSSDFGKIRVRDTRFEVTGGMASIVTLASRLLTMSSKSGKKVTPLNAVDKEGKPKFGAKTGQDVVVDFFANKLSPAAAIVRDLLRGRDFSGEKPTVISTAVNLAAPIPVTNAYELYSNPNAAPMLLALIADALGIGTNTYSSKR